MWSDALRTWVKKKQSLCWGGCAFFYQTFVRERGISSRSHPPLQPPQPSGSLSTWIPEQKGRGKHQVWAQNWGWPSHEEGSSHQSWRICRVHFRTALHITWTSWEKSSELTERDQENAHVFSVNSSNIFLEELVGSELAKILKSVKHFIKAGVICSTGNHTNPSACFKKEEESMS